MTQECHPLNHSILDHLVVKETHSLRKIGTQNFILGNEDCLQYLALLNEQYTSLKQEKVGDSFVARFVNVQR
jgi:hypothetical protein